jgi:hypothetical protein
MDDIRKEQQLPLAEVKPGDFPLCSMESRAAARAFAESKNRAKQIIQIVLVSPDGSKEDGPRIELDANLLLKRKFKPLLAKPRI